MTVAEFIDRLRACPQDFEVVMPDQFQCDYDPVEHLDVDERYRQVKLR